jgi:preprotein translocase subunit YajC
MGGSAFNIILLVVAVGLVVVMIINGRRNRAKQAALRAEMVPGSDIMTNFGLFGKLLSVNDVTNVAEVETSPGVIVKVHRQTLSKVVTPEELDASAPAGTTPRSVEEAMEIANREQAEREASAKIDAEAPEYGVRVEDDEDPITKATTKRAPRAPKKTAE